jgi:hypothetical protein
MVYLSCDSMLRGAIISLLIRVARLLTSKLTPVMVAFRWVGVGDLRTEFSLGVGTVTGGSRTLAQPIVISP